MQVGGTVGWIVWSLGLIGALVTSIYTFRMLIRVFSGRPSAYAAEHAPVHTAHGEGPFSMLWTIGVLAGGVILTGLLEIPGVTHGMRDFLAPSVPHTIEPTAGQELFTSVLSVGVALAGLGIAWAIWGPNGRGAQAYARATDPLPAVLEQKFGFDAAYDLLFYRPTTALATLGAQIWEGRVIAGSTALVGTFGRWLSGRFSLMAVRPRPELRPRVRCRNRGDRRVVRRQGRHVSGAGMHSWTATLLWVVPLATAIVVGLLPLDRRVGCTLGFGALAFLIGDLAVAAERFHPAGGVQFQQSHSWVSDIGLGYHVGLDGLSLVLCGLVAFVAMWCLAFGIWAGRSSRGYVALSLLLVAALMLLFSARDLILFYVGFEAMLIPLAFQMGIWGGERRVQATTRFLVYTLAGSLLMLVSMITLGLRAGSFDLDKIGTSGSTWLFLGVHDRVRDQGAALPVPRLGALGLPRVAGRGRGDALGRRLQGRRLRDAALRAAAVPGTGRGLPAGPARPCRSPACSGARSSPSASPTRAA